ncbi:MAG: transpeptidase family protein [Spirochaetes bacterium]|nr:transpeptidase family protein [Spirochaetota bacterium]
MDKKKRLIVLASAIGAFALFLLINYGILMLSGQPAAQPGQAGSMEERGAILDRNGRFLAMQARFYDISLWRPSVNNMDALINQLAPILGQSPAEMRQRIDATSANFLYIQRQVDMATSNYVRAALAEHRIQGVRVAPVVGRVYPLNTLASQVIGFVGNDNSGLAGIEFAFDGVLAGMDGGQVMLTIDTTVQHILERIATQTLVETGAESVIFMAMDPRNGHILGSASVPGFDPNNIQASSAMQRMDRPALWAFEPGSTFKVFSIAAIMDAGVMSGSTQFFCNGSYVRVTNLGERIVINCLGHHGWVNARDIIAISCNAGTAHAAALLGNAEFNGRMRDFGFGARTGAGNPGETFGILRQPEQWSDRSRATIALGQEISVSALQMIQAASAIANDGVLVPPRIVSAIVAPDGTLVSDWDGAPFGGLFGGTPRRVLQPETARAMREYMAHAATFAGTGWRAAITDIPIGVKTGTAQMIDPQTGTYSNTDFIASTIALVPADNPALVLYVAVIKPQGEIFGGRIAAPAIGQAAEALVDYLGILRGRNQMVLHPASININTPVLPLVYDYVPDFSGLAKRALLPLLARNDINVQIHGNGWVRRQYPPAGYPLTAGSLIVLELE